VGAIVLHRIEIWGPAVPGNFVSLEFTQETTTFIGSPSIIYSDTSVSSTYPAYCDIRPPPNSLSGFFVSGNATSTGHMVDLAFNASECVMDLHVTVTMLDQTTVGQAVTGSGLTAGVMYQKILAGGSLIPVSFPGY
jgi:hypothetical protein